MSIDHLARVLRLGDTRVPGDDRRRAAVAAILHEGSVLLMERAQRAGDPWSGHISLPGGGYQPGDRDLLATAIRETQEEIGIDLAGARVLGNLAPLHPRTSGPAGIEVTPFVFVPTAPLEPSLGPEAVATFWLPLELARSGKLDDVHTYPGIDMKFPCWAFQGHVIWGLTWRILGDLLASA